MLQRMLLCLSVLLLVSVAVTYGQNQNINSEDPGSSSTSDRILNFPSKLFSRIQHKTADLNQQLTSSTLKYLARMQRREDKLRKKLYPVDSTAAKNLFANSDAQYAAMAQKLRNDTGSSTQSVSGEYRPYTDSLQGVLSFLQKNPQLLNSPGTAVSATSGSLSTATGLSTANGLTAAVPPSLQASVSQLQALQAKMQDAGAIHDYIAQRQQTIGQYIGQHANLTSLLGSQYQAMNQQLYYYTQQVNQYKDMLNNPDQLEQKALSLLNQLPAFQTFMKNNSQLAGLFNLPGNYGTPEGLAGLQTKDQVAALIQGQVASGGAGGAAALQSSLESAENQMDNLKNKLSQYGNGSGDIDMTDFKPNNQKTKTFWKRLEYGTNFQTTRNSYAFPTVTDFGLSVGFRINDKSTVGVGASYKLGWGNGINHIAFSSQGAGLRSFLDIKLKGSFSATGGLEYNYETPLTSFQQVNHLSYWTESGLIGVTKTVSMKSRVFKKTQLQLLWDFLSYQQIPKTQPILFRIGYTF